MLPQKNPKYNATHDPSISLDLANKYSPNHFSGLSGSFRATHFMPSNRLGVTFVFMYARVGLPVSPFAELMM